eukprot:scaffold189345_cov23-Tisochrysis_lutea.AAC.4
MSYRGISGGRTAGVLVMLTSGSGFDKLSGSGVATGGAGSGAPISSALRCLRAGVSLGPPELASAFRCSAFLRFSLTVISRLSLALRLASSRERVCLPRTRSLQISQLGSRQRQERLFPAPCPSSDSIVHRGGETGREARQEEGEGEEEVRGGE